MAGFKIKIGADTVEITKSLAELRNDLAMFKKQLSAATNAQDIIRLNKAIADTERAVKTISGAQSIGAIGRDMKELPVGFNLAGNAVGNFSRIVQDAPWAFLQGNLAAISNNIDPAIQSFVYLRQQTGSAGAAFKALGSSLLGSGGLLLGFSLVNAALTYFTSRSAFAKDKTKELSDTIRDSAQVEREATASTAGQIATISALAGVVSNTNKSYKERQRALQELREINKNYFGDLKLEDAATGRLTSTINEYSKAIVNAAIQKEFAQEIAKVAKAASDADAELVTSTTKLRQAEQALAKARAESRPTGREGTGVSAEEARAQSNLNDAFEKQRAAREKVTDLLTDQALLTERLNKAVQAGIQLKDLDTDKTKKETDALKQRIEALQKLQSEVGLTNAQRIELAQLEIQLATRDSIKLGFTPAELQQRIQGIIDKSFPGEQVTSRLKIRVIGDLDTAQLSIDKQGQNINVNDALGLDKIDATKLNPVVAALLAAAKAKQELLKLDEAKQFADFISNQLGPIFTDLFANITTDSESAFKAFAKAVGDLIKRLIAAAVAAAALSAILSAIFPGLGGFKKSFLSIFSSLTGLKFADGGITQGPASGFLAKVHPNEANIPLSRLPQLIGSQSGGGGMSGEFSARIVDGGQDLYVIFNRQSNRFNRKY